MSSFCQHAIVVFHKKGPLSGAVLCLGLLFAGENAGAQKADTTDKIKITIINSRFGSYFKTDSGEYNKFTGDVILQQGTDTLYCDSAYQNSTTKNFEAFSNVKIAQQDGTQGTSDYLKYTADKKLAFMRGNVHLTDGKNKLNCEELTYDLGTKTAIYNKGGTLYNDSTKVTSNAGVYNVNTKDAHFTGHVVIIDPQYKIVSEDLVYNTESKLTQFYAQSVVTRDSGKSILQTKDGTYAGKNGIAHFVGHSSIWNDGQYIEGDTLNYNKLTGYGLANGHVISIDTVHHSKMYCGHAEYFQKKRILWATIKPVLVQMNGKDTLYMRADSFYSAPMVKLKVINHKLKAESQKDSAVFSAQQRHFEVPYVYGGDDTVDNSIPMLTFPGIRQNMEWEIPTTAKNKKGRKVKAGENMAVTDTATADTTAPMYFIGYHHVRIFSDSLQGKCDSVSYTRSDSIIRMIYAPITWAHNSQIMGDTIIMQLDSNHIRTMFVPNNAFVASQSGPPKAQLYDQVQGKTLTAYFKNNEIDHMVVVPDAESIYYSKDEKNAYLGVNQASSRWMRIYFDDQKIKTIKFEDDVHQTMTPLEKADLPNTRLSRFKWLIEQRPKTKEELFE